MKKKLAYGFSVLLLIFIIGGIIVIQNFSETRGNQKVISLQESALHGFESIVVQSLDAIKQIVKYQMGFGQDLEPLIKSIEQLDQDIDFLEKKYYGQYQSICLRCHKEDRTQALQKLEKAFNDIKEIAKLYKLKASILITSRDENLKKRLEREIFSYVEKVVDISEDLSVHISKMKEHLNVLNATLLTRSEMTLAITFILGSFLSFLVIIFTYRGLARPIKTLIKGTEAISNGNYSQWIAIKSKDEIGILAKRFNSMADALLVRDEALKESYRKLERTNDILNSSKNELEIYKEELEEKVEERTEKIKEMQGHFIRCETLSAVGKLAAGISHELSSPLGTILGFTQILLEEMEDSDPRIKDLENIERETIRCERIIKGLLNFARTPVPQTLKVHIDLLLKETLNLITYQPALKKISVLPKFGKNLPPIEVDPEQLKQVFLNVIMNAVQAMPEGGHLEVALSSGQTCAHIEETKGTGKILLQEEEFECLKISFIDTGCGIPPSHYRKIFEPFFTTKTSQEGTGLGLSISHSIVEQHGGRIEVASQVGQGSTFTIILPIFGMSIKHA